MRGKLQIVYADFADLRLYREEEMEKLMWDKRKAKNSDLLYFGDILGCKAREDFFWPLLLFSFMQEELWLVVRILTLEDYNPISVKFTARTLPKIGDFGVLLSSLIRVHTNSWSSSFCWNTAPVSHRKQKSNTPGLDNAETQTPGCSMVHLRCTLGDETDELLFSFIGGLVTTYNLNN